MAPIGVKLIEFRWKKWCRRCRKPFGINFCHKKFTNFFRFFDPKIFSVRPIQIHTGAPAEIWASVSRNIRRITRFALWDIFLIYCGPQSKSTLRWTQSNDLPWFPDTPYIGPTGPAVAPYRNCLGPLIRGGGACRCYTIVSISRPGTYAIMSAHNINPTNGSTFRRWADVCQKLFSEEGHSACCLLLVACLLLACCLELGPDHWCQYIYTEHKDTSPC